MDIGQMILKNGDPGSGIVASRTLVSDFVVYLLDVSSEYF